MTTPAARTLEDVIAAHAIGADSDRGTGDEEVLCVCGVGWISPTLHAAHVAEQVREQLARVVEAALLEAWDDGNALGLDGWIGPERGETPDSEAIIRRAEHVRAALAATLGGVR